MKNGKVKRIIAALVFTALAGCEPSLAFAGTMTGGANLPEQIVQEVTLTQQLSSQAQSLVQQIDQYQNMVQNMTTLPQSLMSQINGALDSLTNLTSQAQALSMSGQNLSSQFAQMQTGQNQTNADAYAQNYQQISNNLSQADNNALQAANLNPSNFATTAQAQQAISNALANPQSRNALLQGSVAAGQALVAQSAQLVQTTNAEATMQASVNKANLARQNADLQMSTNALSAMDSGGPLTSNAPSLASYSLSGY
ncbi:conjugal transfer protein TrbJ [Acidithiobacillus ferrooxidans]|uniref:conjugal transfer protein TrbJ n=1 Tax=Acidithiobacillus ferrooxidans TaxID=920 RepID=UPI001C07BFAE|nr:conjugal transfer protein TrbJ [Acidithiobacillus ferrooxidans]MBU2862030.1 conjugal transfer protein TrbJ [Acidithiobacillus ferrooxidans]